MTDPSSHPQPHHGVIVGAGPGIGASVARRFAREGYRLSLLARDVGRLETLADGIRSTGAEVEVRGADAADPEGLRTALVNVLEVHGTPSAVIYNAAMLVPTTLLTVTPAELVQGYSVDVIGAVVAAQVFLPAMQEKGSGTLLLTSGSAAIRPSPGIATVSLGKAALRSAGTMLASAVVEDGVHVVSVTVSGAVQPGTPFDPDRIADFYWRLHTQHPGEWRSEEPFDGQDH